MACNHLSEIDPDLAPRVDGVCEECVKEGTTWVSLRVCKTCGHVGCCDSSPRKHARAHYADTGHPIIGPVSNLPSDWLWCYPDDTYVERD
ncbi:MAG: hypothetical protein CVT67_10585 [Actinobacteria bacterium HGW-Actinobacteria-7]|jgi:CPA1 family monovalent cation:H+ antiporter|nr:MAG: hypothetical protein CVT67_10585 [Actinobacteria bacterium HGW-Actinobacteria-7]